MALISDYTAGTVDLTTATKTVTGSGTAWQTARFQEGDWFIAGGYVGIIASVDSETQITLVDNWAGATLSDASYRLRYMSDGSRSTAQARALIDLLGTHAFFDPDASGDLAGRDVYDDREAGFAYLVLDSGQIYYKASAGSGDWAGPFAYAQGEQGDAATVTVGTTTTVAAGQPAAVTNSGSSGAAVLDFDIPEGPKGDTGAQGPKGDTGAQGPQGAKGDTGAQGPAGTINSTKGDYAGATAYLTGDVVLDQGSSWVALQDTTGNAPPTLPTSSNAYWQLIARKGEDGSGTGDMKASVYDPQGIDADAFDRANHTGEELIENDVKAIQIKPSTATGAPSIQWTNTTDDETARLLYDFPDGYLRITDRVTPGGSITAEVKIDGPNSTVGIIADKLQFPASNAPVLTDPGDMAIDLNGDNINTDGVLKFVNGAGETVTVWGGQQEPAEVNLGQVFAFDGLQQRPRWGAVTGRRNLIIGGCFDTNPWQRGTTFTSPANGAYAADMFNVIKVGSGDFDIKRTVDSPPHQMINATGTHCLDFEVTTADTSISGNDLYGIRYFVEGYDWTQIAWHAMNLSFYVKASVAGTYSLAMRNDGGDRVLIAEYTIDAVDTWQRAIIPLSGGIQPEGGAWNFTNGVGCTIIWTVAAGPDRQGVDTAGRFLDSAASDYATANQVNLMATVGNHFKIDRIQLENSQIATRFEFQSRGEVLDACRRYYRKFDGRLRLNPTTGTADSTVRGGTLQLHPPMRATPSISGETYLNSWSSGPNYQASAEAVEITGNVATGSTGQALTEMILDASL